MLGTQFTRTLRGRTRAARLAAAAVAVTEYAPRFQLCTGHDPWGDPTTKWQTAEHPAPQYLSSADADMLGLPHLVLDYFSIV